MKLKTAMKVFCVLGIVTIPNVVMADVGLPMIFLGLPFAGIVLIPVILIECFVYSKCLELRFARTLKPVALANLISTLIGYPLSWALLLTVELLTTGGAAYGISSFAGKVIAVTLQAAWLIPYDDSDWMVPCAGLIGLIPAFFLSVLIERWFLRKFFWGNFVCLNAAVWRANIWSYLLLASITLATLALS